MNPFFQPEPPFVAWRLSGLGGASVHLRERCESTHRFMHEHFASLPAGTVVVANDQTGGRGRHDRIWRTPAGKNLAFSMLIPLDGLAPERWAQLTQVAATVWAGMLNEQGVKASVKWPNDLLVSRQKICGILSEILRNGEHRCLSLGIGMNVNTDPADFEGLDRPATSLKIITGKNWNREVLLQQFLQRFAQALEQFREQGPRAWIESWRKMDNFLGTPGQVVEAGKTVAGTIVDIQPDGSLLFRTADGRTMNIWSGDLEI